MLSFAPIMPLTTARILLRCSRQSTPPQIGEGVIGANMREGRHDGPQI
jgi:hypothetical protein